MSKVLAPLAARNLVAALFVLFSPLGALASEAPGGATQALFREVSRFGPTGGQILQAEVSLEGCLVAAVTQEGTGLFLRVYEIDSGKALFAEKAEHIYDIAWGADRQLYVLVRGEAGIAVSRVALGDAQPRAMPFVAVAALLNLSVDGYELAVSADGKRIAVHDLSVNRRGMLTWYDSNRRELGRGAGGLIPATDYSQFGPLTTWNGTSQRTTARLRGMKSVAFSPDGKLLACLHADRVVRVWDVARRAVVMQARGLRHVLAGLDFTPEGKLVVGGGGQELTALDTRNGRVVPLTEGEWEPLPGQAGVIAVRPAQADVPDPTGLGFNVVAETGRTRLFVLPSRAQLSVGGSGEWALHDRTGKKVDLPQAPPNLFNRNSVRLIGLANQGRQMVVAYEPVAQAGSNKDLPGLLGVWDTAALLRHEPSNVPGK